MYQHHKGVLIQGSSKAYYVYRIVLCMINKTDLRVKYTAGLNESHVQEPVIVFFTTWVILMEIGWDRQCPRATGPSPPFLGMGSWSGWVWKEASNFCLALCYIRAMWSWFGPEPQQWYISGAAEVESFSSWSNSSLQQGLPLSMCVCVRDFKSVIISFHTVYVGQF